MQKGRDRRFSMAENFPEERDSRPLDDYVVGGFLQRRGA
jgi:hypothetical protein